MREHRPFLTFIDTLPIFNRVILAQRIVLGFWLVLFFCQFFNFWDLTSSIWDFDPIRFAEKSMGRTHQDGRFSSLGGISGSMGVFPQLFGWSWLLGGLGLGVPGIRLGNDNKNQAPTVTIDGQQNCHGSLMAIFEPRTHGLWTTLISLVNAMESDGPTFLLDEWVDHGSRPF